MGSTFYTVDEACSRLKRSRRSVWDYIRKGFLGKEFRSGKVVLPIDDVEQLAISLGSNLPPLTRQAWFLLQSRVQKLEQEMVTVRTILEVRSDPVRLDAKTARGYYEAAKHYLAVAGSKGFELSEENVDQWADLFVRTDEQTLDALVKANLEPTAWRPLYEWCVALIDLCRKKDKERASLAWQARAHKLEQGRKKVRDTIIFWVESGRGTTPTMLADILDPQKETLMRRLGANG